MNWASIASASYMFFVVQDVIDWATQRVGMQTTVLVLSRGMLLLCLRRCDVLNCFVTAVCQEGCGQTPVCTPPTLSAVLRTKKWCAKQGQTVFHNSADVRLSCLSGLEPKHHCSVYKSQPYERVETRLEPFHTITPCLFNIHVNLYCYPLYSLNSRDSSMNMVNTLLAPLRYKRMNF